VTCLKELLIFLSNDEIHFFAAISDDAGNLFSQHR
jgi:hypothetical protein